MTNLYTPLNEGYRQLLKGIATDYKEEPLYDGLHYVAHFNNGYGISIIKHLNSDGHESDLWEIAVLKGNEICYDTDLASDMIGWLTDEEVLTYAMKIDAFDPLKGE